MSCGDTACLYNIKALIQFFDCKITLLNSQHGNTKVILYSKNGLQHLLKYIYIICIFLTQIWFGNAINDY